MSKVSTIQLNSGPNVKVNLYDVKTFIEQIADVGSKLVVLPENFALMPENDADYIKHAEELGDGQIQNYLSDLASSYKIWIVGGTIPIKSKDKDRVMASTITYNEKGKQVSLYNKIHLFDVTLPKSKESYNESKYFMPGDKIEVIDTPIGRAGIACCYDLRFPEMSRILTLAGSEVLIAPSAWVKGPMKEEHWITINKTRAIENGCYVVSPDQVGNIYCGRSLVVDPYGKVLVDMKKKQGISFVDIDLKKVKEIRKVLPLLKNRRADTYSTLKV